MEDLREVVEVIKDEQNVNRPVIVLIHRGRTLASRSIAGSKRIVAMETKNGRSGEKTTQRFWFIINRLENFPIAVNCGAHEACVYI